MPDTSAVRTKTRRLKNLALDRAIEILEHPEDYDKETYETTYHTVLKNSVPRTQEITGDDGERIQVQITGMRIIKEEIGGDNIHNQEPQTAESS